MTATLVGSPTTTTGGTGTGLTVNLPSSPTVGNLLIMILGFWTTAPTTPSGWTQADLTADASSMRLATYTRTVTGTEGSTLAVSGYVSGDPRTAIVVVAAGANGIDLASSALVVTAPYNCPAITTTSANDLVLVSVFSETTGTATLDDFPAGTTTLVKIKSSVVGGWAGLQSLGSRTQATAGSTGTTTVTTTGTGMSTSEGLLTLAIKPGVDPTQFFRML